MPSHNLSDAHVCLAMRAGMVASSGEVVDTISLRAGVVADGCLPQTARAMAHHVQGGTARDAEACATESGRLVYSRCSFDRVTHAVGELYGDHNGDIDDTLITAYEPPAETRSISVGLDRVSLPTSEPRPRPAGRPKKYAPKRPITVAWRMMWVATVTLHDRNGDALHTIRYGAMPDDGCESLLHGAAGDVNELLRKRPRLEVCLLCTSARSPPATGGATPWRSRCDPCESRSGSRPSALPSAVVG
jgi:hypothetical protein